MYRRRPGPAPSIKAVIWESFRVFNTPTRMLVLALLCSSWTLRAIPRVLAQNSDSANQDRSNVFQVLADGTQDLAALIGVFATDSVERYAVDYSRGYLSVAMATCSLLGILGYMKALVKLAMGQKACEGAAFPTAPVRSILGVSESDRVPKEELVEITYVTRTTIGNNIRYTAVKRMRHTQESFPVAYMSFKGRRDWESPDHKHKFGSCNMPVLSRRGKHMGAVFMQLYNKIKKVSVRHRFTIFLIQRFVTGEVSIFGSLTITAALTSFLILPVTSVWSWSRILASFGLFASLSFSSIMWAYVCIKQQMVGLSLYYQEPGDLDSFALMHTVVGSEPPVLCELHAISGGKEWMFRLCSLIAGAFIAVGYICQYVEVRRTSTNQAAVWLGCQTALALIRVLLWILDPKFDDFIDSNSTKLIIKEREIRFDPTAFAYLFFSRPASIHTPVASGESFEIPLLLSERLMAESFDIIPLLELAYRIATSNDIQAMEWRQLLDNCTAVWAPPNRVFRKWIAHVSNGNDSTPSTDLYSGVIVRLGGEPWEGSRIVLLLVINYNLINYNQNLYESEDEAPILKKVRRALLGDGDTWVVQDHDSDTWVDSSERMLEGERAYKIQGKGMIEAERAPFLESVKSVIDKRSRERRVESTVAESETAPGANIPSGIPDLTAPAQPESSKTRPPSMHNQCPSGIRHSEETKDDFTIEIEPARPGPASK